MSLRTKWQPGDRFLVRHKDAAIVVAEKKAGLLTHAGPDQPEPSLLSALREFLGPRNRHLKAVHRLDRVVSGLLVFARTERAFDRLKSQFAARTVERSYLAAVAGSPDHEEDRLEDPLDVEPMTVRIVDPEHPRARTAALRYQVRERLTAAGGAVLGVRLETGLRNQIRVQLAGNGMPLFGERKYHPKKPRAQGSERIFLHAETLGFEHPITGAALRFEAAMPPDLRRWLERLRRGPSERCPAPRRPRRRSGG